MSGDTLDDWMDDDDDDIWDNEENVYDKRDDCDEDDPESAFEGFPWSDREDASGKSSLGKRSLEIENNDSNDASAHASTNAYCVSSSSSAKKSKL